MQPPPSPSTYFVRVGTLGSVGRFRTGRPDLARGTEVVCRTARGDERGEVLTLERHTAADRPVDGAIVRPLTETDRLWLERIERTRDEAYLACVERLHAAAPGVQLADIELLLDGSSLYFYFLGEVTPAVEQLTAELAETYDTKAQVRRFTEAVEQGCGPDCGTSAAKGCGDSCSSCAAAGACSKG